ncbi:MAG: cytochrome C oxidase subunit IV family protein [Planctomycetes bacterium]|nr:cytochrome C oxidase subunit IV family protein [Planctomycetota bacterium]
MSEGSHTKLYTAIFAGLVVLTALTVGISRVHLGGVGNVAVGLLIAFTKATLVALFFMHLKYDGKYDRYFYVAAVFPLVLFAILLSAPMGDLVWLSPP